MRHRAAVAAGVIQGLSAAEIANLLAVVEVVTAGRALGVGRTTAYRLAREGQFPCRVIRIGRALLVPTTELLALLGLDQPTRVEPEQE